MRLRQASWTALTKLSLRILARWALSLEEEVKEIDRLLKTLVNETAPQLCAVDGVGPDVASAILVAAGDNPERLKSEATFAKLCGVSPLDASSGKQGDTDSTDRAAARPTPHCGTSCSPGWSTICEPVTTSSDG
jgi:transposase